MKNLLLFILIGFCINQTVLAQAVEPVINKNVHVIQNTTPAQCPTSWRGSIGSSIINNDTSAGISNSQVDAGIQSCTGCAYDSQSRDCVCSTCYGDFN